MSGSMDEMVIAVKRHALLNYESDGWDYVIEFWADEDIMESIGKCRTIKGAIKAVGNHCKLLDSWRTI